MERDGSIANQQTRRMKLLEKNQGDLLPSSEKLAKRAGDGPQLAATCITMDHVAPCFQGTVSDKSQIHKGGWGTHHMVRGNFR